MSDSTRTILDDVFADPTAGKEDFGIKERLGEAMGVTVLSAQYMGKDASDRPIWRVTYQPQVVGPFSLGYASRTKTTKTVTFSGGEIGTPSFSGSGVDDATDGLTGEQGAILAKAKQDWLIRISNMNISDDRKVRLFQFIDSYQGNPLGLARDIERHPAFWKLEAPGVDEPTDQEDFFDLFDFSSFGGGGAVGPTYVAPDRRVVEDFVKGAMVSLIGTVDETLLEPLVNLYMTDHRRDFDTAGQQIDPSQSVLEHLRNTDQYQTIHSLRPESVDERQWIGQRRTAGAQGGLQQDLQEDFAIEQATIGGDLADVRDAGAVAQVQASGSARGTTIENKIKRTAVDLFRGVA